VLQARIPEQLDEELRERSAQLGLSVSTIVRNVLLNTFDLVEGVVADSAQVGRALQGRAARPSAPPAAEPETAPDDAPVVAWQEGVLNMNGCCDRCNTILPKGSRAAVGVPFRTRPVFLCLDCLAAIPPESSAEGPSEPAAAGAPRRGRQ
jgi:hypothetical protein